MIKLKLIFLYCIITEQSIQAIIPSKIDDKRYPELSKFIKKHQCSDKIKHQLQDSKDALEGVKPSIQKYTSLPFYVKNNDVLARIDNARRTTQVINNNGLDLITVPEKCLCNLEDDWYVIAHKVEDTGDKLVLSKQEVQQLLTFAEKTGYRDWHQDNIIRDKYRKIFIIDTERTAYSYTSSRKNPFDWLLNENNVTLEYEAVQYIADHQNAWESRLLLSNYSICSDPKYNDPSIDFRKATKEFCDFKSYQSPEKIAAQKKLEKDFHQYNQTFYAWWDNWRVQNPTPEDDGIDRSAYLAWVEKSSKAQTEYRNQNPHPYASLK